jgi:amino acid transporter
MVAMMFTANSYAQMSRAFPMAGSVYTYAGRGLSPWVGFLAGWAILLDYVLVPALLYLVASVAMASIVPAIPVWAWLAAFVVLNTIVNYMGIQMTAKVNKVMLALELIVLAIFLVVGLVAVANGKGNGFSTDAFFNSDTFTVSLVLGAVSIAVLSFLGFDGISMLAEENRDAASSIGRAMVAALLLAGALFIAQTWVASMLVPDAPTLLSEGDAEGTAFYDAARVGGGEWLAWLTAFATAVAWGFANSLVAQAATSRLLYAMARDRQLPSFLAKVHKTHKVPVNATLLVAVISLVLGLYMATRDDGISLLSTLVNFGAMSAFLVLHLSVINYFVRRRHSKDWLKHLVFPLIGFAILAFVVVNAKVAAQVLAFLWIAIGIAVLIAFKVMHKEPQLAVLEED